MKREYPSDRAHHKLERCRGAHQKVAPIANKAGLNRSTRCPECNRNVAINYDGTIRRHVPKPLRRDRI